MRVRSSVIGLLYEKALVLSNESRAKSTAGEIVNLMSVDAQRLMDVMTYINMIWSAPFQVGVSLYFLHRTMGWSIYVGLGVMVVFTPLTFSGWQNGQQVADEANVRERCPNQDNK
ncbi:Multidrug resistance-associated protein 1 [Desmophyllum pertusum]|uniref:Multidrug resistance-associated protein 1 n=1 Tax=Desmophyllum pertusum TaxID=174260 RepID=A0A9W9ZZE0_9CNID|nr:Multidrug resistance-associated protein 1 [Desmophyllum pertusum]